MDKWFGVEKLSERIGGGCGGGIGGGVLFIFSGDDKVTAVFSCKIIIYRGVKSGNTENSPIANRNIYTGIYTHSRYNVFVCSVFHFGFFFCKL